CGIKQTARAGSPTNRAASFRCVSPYTWGRFLFALWYGEREKNVSRHGVGIAAVNKKHSADYQWPGCHQRPTARFHPVDRWELPSGVEIPNHLPSLGLVSPQVAIEGTGEYNL